LKLTLFVCCLDRAMVADPGSLDLADSNALIHSLRHRLRQALAELGSCREKLSQQCSSEKQDSEAAEATDQVVASAANFSCVLGDHADILGPFVDCNYVAETSIPQPQVQQAEQSESTAPQSEQPERQKDAETQTMKEEEPTLKTILEQQRQQHQREEQELLSQALEPSPGGGASSSSQAAEAASQAVLAAREQHEKCERDRRKLEEDLSMAKALLMLSNVHLNMDFDHEASEAQVPPAQPVSLKGNRKLVQALITLKQKVSLLNQQYLLLRGDMLYLSHEMNVCRHWVLQSFKMAMQHQSQEHSSLQTRFERLAKVLN